MKAAAVSLLSLYEGAIARLLHFESVCVELVSVSHVRELLGLLFESLAAPIDEASEWLLSSVHTLVILERMIRLAPPPA